MVVKMMRWPPWPPLVSRKYEARLVVQRLEGYHLERENTDADKGADVGGEVKKLTVEIRWKGPKVTLSSLRRMAIKRNFTKEVQVDTESLAQNGGVVVWDEEFHSLCNLSAYKDNVFHPWEIAFTVFNGLTQGPKGKVPVLGKVSLNVAEFVASVDQKEFSLNIPLTLSAGAVEAAPSLCVSLKLLELRAGHESTEPVLRSIVPVPSPPEPRKGALSEKDELSAIKAGFRKVKTFKEYVSARRAKKTCHEDDGSEGRCSARSEDVDYNYPFDSDSLDEFEEGDSDEVKDDSTVRKSFSYGTLAYANYAGRSYQSSLNLNRDEDWVYYSNRKSDDGPSQIEESTASASEPSVLQSSKRSILPWRKRKLSFRSPKAKGEPLLKKAYGEEGGDDIDFDRRQLSSDESMSLTLHKAEGDSSAHRSSVSDFGDDNFAVGSWEQKEVTSRDGEMKLQTRVFFASIDQRSERAAGESACTALVAVIADWFLNNPDPLPIKSQFDRLIREGSLEWRNLCENEIYKKRFPDKHFDLETVMQAKINSLSVVPEKSFIGFFHPEGMDEGRFDFLQGAMSFDNIWEEISHAAQQCTGNCDSLIYIVSWNDHFFILKVEQDAYYVIDTLGERLYEGCNQAYVLKFDSSTTIYKLPSNSQTPDEKTANDQQKVATVVEPGCSQAQQAQKKDGNSVPESQKLMKSEQEEEVVLCRGKECCKEYIKSFLAAIPIRELQADIKKGLISSTPLHPRLQIEFHYTQLLHSLAVTPATEVSTSTQESVGGVISEDST